MPGLNNINQLRAVGNWATTYLWDIRFLDAPYPFNEWFPASNVEEPIFHIETHNITAHIIQTEIPKSIQMTQISIECYDSSDHILENWFKQWFYDMFNKYKEVTPLFQITRVLEIARLTYDKKVIYANRYYIFPKGNLNVTQNSQSSMKKLNVSFGIAGYELVPEGLTTRL